MTHLYNFLSFSSNQEQWPLHIAMLTPSLFWGDAALSWDLYDKSRSTSVFWWTAARMEFLLPASWTWNWPAIWLAEAGGSSTGQICTKHIKWADDCVAIPVVHAKDPQSTCTNLDIPTKLYCVVYCVNTFIIMSGISIEKIQKELYVFTCKGLGLGWHQICAIFQIFVGWQVGDNQIKRLPCFCYKLPRSTQPCIGSSTSILPLPLPPGKSWHIANREECLFLMSCQITSSEVWQIVRKICLKCHTSLNWRWLLLQNQRYQRALLTEKHTLHKAEH